MKNEINKILFVCTGNSCRSIMAEAYLRHVKLKRGLDLEIRSAGTMGINGMAPSENTVNVLQENGISTDKLMSTGLTKDLVKWADIILVMEAMHRDTILAMDEQASEKLFFLGGFSEGYEYEVIPDPIGRSLEYYRISFKLIKKSIEGLLLWLEK